MGIFQTYVKLPDGSRNPLQTTTVVSCILASEHLWRCENNLTPFTGRAYRDFRTATTLQLLVVSTYPNDIGQPRGIIPYIYIYTYGVLVEIRTNNIEPSKKIQQGHRMTHVQVNFLAMFVLQYCSHWLQNWCPHFHNTQMTLLLDILGHWTSICEAQLKPCLHQQGPEIPSGIKGKGGNGQTY